jgi:hypothetical protein
MKGATILCLVLLAASVAAGTGCRSQAVRDESDDADVAIDQAVARGADIPPDKRGIVTRMLHLSEKDLVLGLYTFADLSAGRYPMSLETRSTLQEVEVELKPEMSKSTKERMLQDIFFATAFYEKLQRERRSVQYHGAAVSRQDGSKILMSWSLSKDRHRAVLGDLSLCTLTTKQLAQFE